MKERRLRVVKILAAFFILLFSQQIYSQTSIFTSQVPGNSGNDGDYELGLKFSSSESAQISAIRFYKMPGETGTHTATLWSNTGNVIATASFVGETGSGWQYATFSNPVMISSAEIYVASININSIYAIEQHQLDNQISNGMLTALAGGGVFNETPAGFPNQTYQNSNYFVDVVESTLNRIFTTESPAGEYNDGPYELGVKFTTSQPAKVKMFSYYKMSGESGTHIGNLWTSTGTLLATATFANETASGWQYAALSSNIYLTPGNTYVVSVNSNSTYAAGAAQSLSSSITNGILSTVADGNNGVFSGNPNTQGQFPTVSFNNNNYFRDIIVEPISAPTVPTLLSPVNSAGSVSLDPTLQWSLISGATYTLQVATDISFNNLIFNQAGITSTSFNLAGLSNTMDYYWRVSAEKDFVSSGYSSINKFSTIVISGPIPIISWPIENPTVYLNPPSLYWYLGTYAPGVTYEIQCIEASAPWPPDNVFATSSTLSFTMPYSLNGGVQYAWRVRSTNGVTKSNWSTTALFTMVAATNNGPVIPITSWPKGNPTQYTNPPTLYWYHGTAVTGLTYEIQCVVASDPWPADNVYATSSTLSFTMPYTLSSGVQYAWRVRSTNGITKSIWSSTELFTMVANATSGPVVPITSWPVGNPTEYNNPPTLNWYIGVYAPGLTYEIQCVPAADPWPADNVFATSSGLSYTIPNSLTGGVQYAWRVRSTDGVTKSIWSATELFTMIGNTNSGPVVPIASWPVGNPTEYTNPPTLHWYLGVYATGLTYEIQCVEASAPWPADNVFATTSGLSFTMPYGLNAGVEYAWRVRSTNGSTKSSWSSTELFTMVGSNSSGPVVPIASWPVGNPTEYTNPPTLNWYLGTSTTGLTYELQCVVASDPWPADNVFATSTSLSFTMPYALINGVQYAWRVRSTDGVTKSSWSATALFTMVSNNALVQPLTGSPSNSVTINTRTTKLHWYLPTATTANSTYEVEIADNPEFQKAKIINSTKSNVQVNGLAGGKKYFWKVRSTDGIGKSSFYSSTGEFEVDSKLTAIEEQKEMPTTFQLSQNYPNPFNPTTVIEYSIPSEGTYSLAVFNILGEKVSTLINGMVSRGNYKITFDGKDFASGIYLYKLSGKSVNLTRKMLLIK